MERWASEVIAAQQPPGPDRTWDYSLVGDILYDGLPIVPPYTYIDSPVADVVAEMQTLIGGCAQRMYAGSVVAADDPAPLTAEPTDLVLRAATIADVCRDEGWLSQFEASLADEGLVDDVIGDVPVHRRDNAVVIVDGADVYQLTSDDPATLVAMAPFITAFVTRDLPPDVTDDTTLPVGTCLYRAPASANGSEASRRTFAVGCTEPHQGEVFHRFEVTVPPGEPYPGDTEAVAPRRRRMRGGLLALHRPPLQRIPAQLPVLLPDRRDVGDRRSRRDVHRLRRGPRRAVPYVPRRQPAIGTLRARRHRRSPRSP